MSIKCQLSVDRKSIEVSIAGIDRHSIAGVFSTHDPNSGVILLVISDNPRFMRLPHLALFDQLLPQVYSLNILL